MPLRCLDRDGASLHAFAIAPGDWEALAAANRAAAGLTMPCCGARVRLKRSKLGLQFFAHAVGGSGCATGDETPEHLALKQHAIEAARAAGWTAETEVAAADGSWRADVLATRGQRRVAVEIQWSPQGDDETLRRTAQYADAGVRVLWLFRQRGFPHIAEVPALRVGGSMADGFTIDDVDVASALRGVFERRLSFGFPAGTLATVRVIGGVAECWGRDCGALTRVVAGVELSHAASRCSLVVEDLPLAAAATHALIAALPFGDMLGRVRARRTGDPARLQMTNGCFRCDRVLDTRGIARSTRAPLLALDLRIDADLAAVIAASPAAVLRWGIAPTRVAPPAPTR